MSLYRYIFGVSLLVFAPFAVSASSCILQGSYTNAVAENLMGAIPGEKLASFADRLTHLSGCQFNTNVYPIARIWHMYEHNQLAIIFGAVHSPQRDTRGVFFELIQIPILWITADRTAQFHTSTEIYQSPKLLLGNVRGIEYNVATAQFIQKVSQTKQVDESVDQTILLKKIRLGRVSGGFINQLSYQQLFKDQMMDGLHAMPIQDLGQTSVGVYVNPRLMSNDEFLRVSQALRQLQKERYQQKLLSKRN